MGVGRPVPGCELNRVPSLCIEFGELPSSAWAKLQYTLIMTYHLIINLSFISPLGHPF